MMHEPQPLLFVSSGLEKPKKRDTSINRQNLYLNYGFLGLASLVAERFPVELVHGRFESAEGLVETLSEAGRLPSRGPLFLSVPSCFALGWARAFSAAVKARRPGVWIVVGGRWALGVDVDWVRRQLPDVDHVVLGTAEHRILELASSAASPIKHWDGVFSEPDLDTLPALNLRLMPDYLLYQPSLEMSRGCGRGCHFCLERDRRLGAMRHPSDAMGELDRYASTYGSRDIHPYFEASFFRPTRRWIEEFAALCRASGWVPSWRCETRADAWAPSDLQLLAQAGLGVVDVGLESASPTQLLRMGKARDPERYLGRAEQLLQACKENGIRVKVNVLLYAGETPDTLEETRTWLNAHAQSISGLSVSPLLVYHTGPGDDLYLQELSTVGATPADHSSLDRDGYVALNLSAVMDAEAADEAALALSREFMDMESYYELKAFSYFSRELTFDDFRSMVASSNVSDLPFCVKPPRRFVE